MSPWAKLDDGMGEHRKTRKLLKAGGLQAMGMHTLAILHCSKYLTDGVIDQDFLEDVAFIANVKPKALEAMVSALVQAGQWDAVGDHWVIHDYLEHNPSKETVEANRGVDRFRKELTRDQALIAAIRSRDGNNCRYCNVVVDWKDRRSKVGGTYDHVIPISQGGENTYENVVVACRGCNGKKGARTPKEAGMFLAGAETDLARGRSDLPPVTSPVPSRPNPVPPSTTSEGGLSSEGGGGLWVDGDPGPEPPCNVFDLRDGKTGAERGAA